ncbi:MAG: hypothetical protein HZB55_14620 [Deltaproteobacteria bacterium]|nr:hypothetical protein [Deltaproteobacteria bacterium]
MTDVLRDLAARIRAEVADLSHTAELAQRRWDKATADSDYLGSVALDLESFYQGVERCLALVAKIVDGRVPSGEQWHQALLAQMAAEVEGVRPAVISEEAKAPLDRLRGFRHVARNVYAFNLSPDKISGLVLGLPLVLELVQADLQAFAGFLEEAASR